jgi:hypothetical protein
LRHSATLIVALDVAAFELGDEIAGEEVGSDVELARLVSESAEAGKVPMLEEVAMVKDLESQGPGRPPRLKHKPTLKVALDAVPVACTTPVLREERGDVMGDKPEPASVWVDETKVMREPAERVAVVDIV